MYVDIFFTLSRHRGSTPLTSTNTNSLLAKVLTLASSFFVSFVAELQGFTENSATNRESQKWTSGGVF